MSRPAAFLYLGTGLRLGKGEEAHPPARPSPATPATELLAGLAVGGARRVAATRARPVIVVTRLGLGVGVCRALLLRHHVVVIGGCFAGAVRATALHGSSVSAVGGA